MLKVLTTGLAKYSLPIFITVILSLAATVHYYSTKASNLQDDLSVSQQRYLQIESQLTQERLNRQSLTDALAQAQRRAREQARVNAQLSQDLNNALDQNREWADTPVPDAVADSLCQQLNCRSNQP